MKFIVLTTACSEQKYDRILKKRKKTRIDSGQKFFNSISKGLAENGFSVDCIVSLPISSGTYPDKIIHDEFEKCENVNYYYLGFLNFPIIRSVIISVKYRKAIKRIIRNCDDQNIVILCDTLIYEASRLVKRKEKNVTYVAVVTDLPQMVDQMFNSGGIKGIFEKKYAIKASEALMQYDKYILLSENMNDICNPHNEPHLVMECISTIIEEQQKRFLSEKPVVLYAGKLLKDCGVVELAKAAKYLENECEIWLYGSNCDCCEELDNEIKHTNNLVVHDSVPHDQLYCIEQSAAILINPRPGIKDFAKFSFPSKTVEYMLCGVPTLVFKLEGIPKEYDSYLYYLTNLSPLDLANDIKRILSIPQEVREEQAKRAQQFIRDFKNEKVQTKRIIDFLE